jgi:small subunit ribosomal protein S2
MATTVSIKSLLEAGVHFGHQTRRWNPKMKPYIFGERNGIYILDLKQTLYALDDAYSFLNNLGAAGKKVLFVGTKKQAQEPIKNNAERAGMPYVNYRWMGGMLTNFQTIRTRVQRMEEIEAMKLDGRFDAHTKKEQAGLNKEHTKLELALGGIRDMHDLPDAIFIVDTKHEDNAVREAHRLHIPIIGLIDTNADPDEIDYGIPANDDAIRSVNLLCSVAADALMAGSGANVTAEEMTAETAAVEAKSEEKTEEVAE